MRVSLQEKNDDNPYPNMIREYSHYEYVTSKHIVSTYYIIKESQRVVMSILCRAGY